MGFWGLKDPPNSHKEEVEEPFQPARRFGVVKHILNVIIGNVLRREQLHYFNLKFELDPSRVDAVDNLFQPSQAHWRFSLSNDKTSFLSFDNLV